MEATERRIVVPVSEIGLLEQTVVAPNVLSCYLVADMLHPGISLSHLLEQVVRVGLLEEQSKGIGQVEVLQPVCSQSDTVLKGATQDKEGKSMKVPLFVDKHIGILDGG